MGTLDGIRTIDDLRLENQRVLVRVDFDVALDPSGKITSDERIRAALPTIKKALGAGARVVLASHLGRPNGKPNPALSLESVGMRLSELLDQELYMPDDCVGDAAKKVVADLRPGGLALLENLRFHPEEEANDEGFAQKLASFCDAYVNDAFGASHRAHASLSALPRLIRDRAMGYLLQGELGALTRVSENPERPFVAVLGGTTISDKIKLLESLLKKCDAICVGGAIANTLLAAAGHAMKASRLEREQLALGRTLLEQARDRKVKLLLPTDVVVAENVEASAGEIVSVSSIPDGAMALDIGPSTLHAFAAQIARAKTVFWNGPLGSCENPAFATGSIGVARALAEASGFTVVSGGDSALAIQLAGEDTAQKINFISTGGGTSLELIEGLKLPGVEALRGN
ncbi:MAG TPA: phosphoglycerate kinase [Polyangiaceae bacterium]|jgi:phosphoglycerate kinase|nr:phosphoglycerate kinase [Polyangiaceae bacterium]